MTSEVEYCSFGFETFKVSTFIKKCRYSCHQRCSVYNMSRCQDPLAPVAMEWDDDDVRTSEPKPKVEEMCCNPYDEGLKEYNKVRSKRPPTSTSTSEVSLKESLINFCTQTGCQADCTVQEWFYANCHQ